MGGLQVIILQGIIGSMPANAFVFSTLYLQLLGMTDLAASIVVAIYLLGATLSKPYPQLHPLNLRTPD